ncbi:MAG: T9SS type A sorting domain-containing protein [Saprospiraceae bacterium]|nr:T9SS type A sorting domain-containing protein [Saprospiraceae bacterium]
MFKDHQFLFPGLIQWVTARRISIRTTLPYFIWSLVFQQLVGQTCLPDGITFHSQAQLDNFSVQFPGCHEIIGYVLIEEAHSTPISSLEGLAQVTRIGQYLEIRNNANLLNLNGLENLKAIGGRMTLAANRSLLNITALDKVEFVGESVRISSNPSLAFFNALGKMKVIRGDFSISDNTTLSHLQGLNDLIEIDGSILINGNAALSSMQGLNGLRKVSGNLLLRDNLSLKDMSGLSNLREVLADFIIDNNRSLITLIGLDALSIVGGYLQIVNNESLQNVKGLDALQSIVGLLQIYNNPVLESLGGLDSIDPRSMDNLAIIDCPTLSDCGVESICDFLKLNEDNYSISRNKSGCNNRLEILKSCNRTGVNVTPQPNIIMLFPNPTNGFVRIGGSIENAELTIQDLTGRLMVRKKQESEFIDLIHLAAGVYRVQLVAPTKSFIGVIIKI